MRILVPFVLCLVPLACSENGKTDTPTEDTQAPEDVQEPAPDVEDLPAPPFEVGEGDHVGIAVVDITPAITETFDDLNGNGTWEGCRDDPAAAGEDCDEPFTDANGNGLFDPVFIAGYDPLRPALGVHDAIECRAMVLAHGNEYLALVSVDLVGLGATRILDARARLAAMGWDPDRIIVSASHTHQGPDTMGFWGDQNPSSIWNGTQPAYNEEVVQAIVSAVTMAAETATEVTVKMGVQHMRDRSEWFNGRHFGGKNPTDKMHGLIHDVRDPVVVSDQVFVLHAADKDGNTVATLVNFSGHPEVVGDENNLLSADYVYTLRESVEARIGGRAMFLPASLGGMQSTLSGHVPLVDSLGEWLMTTDDDGDLVPVMSKEPGFDFARSVGIHLADAAVDIVAEADVVSLDPIQVRVADLLVPLDNGTFQLLFELGLFDADPGLVITDPQLCPEKPADNPLHPGCVPDQTWRVQLGPAEFATAPGELLPELFWGFPAGDPRWKNESETPGLRGSAEERDSAYFPQHPPACDAVPYPDCQFKVTIDECDCTRYHDLPYRISPNAEHLPVRELMTGKYRFLIGMAGDFLGYIIPENDYNFRVSVFAEWDDGDHYEDTVSGSYRFGTRFLEAQHSLNATDRPE